MIPNQWYVILESNEIKKGKIVGMKRMGEKMVAWRNTKGELAVMSDKCPHRGVALSVGKLIGDCIQCPFHGFEYETNGNCKLVPANGRGSEPPKALHVRSYPAKEEHGFVYIWWGEPQGELPPVPWFESIGADMVYTTLKDPWANHYARAIENQLDEVHLPFIHYNTIGRGNKTLVNGPIARGESHWPGDHLINIWVYNERDNGQKPKRASELPEPTRRPYLQFRYGNLWHNWIADGLRVMIAFAPIDDENTLMYVRYYHTMRFPVLRQLYGWVGSLANLVIERQDRRVVITQRPPRPDLGIGEILIPGDSPIVLYRKIRRSLIEGR
ncbi:MAG: aromatic ring-hydroxylating dioxygenase subunit alpha [Anaerolineales bacterium]|jgi:phenylpropionate dioxygenase-like ring-hydroxylating dioxygenase large terminal subunit